MKNSVIGRTTSKINGLLPFEKSLGWRRPKLNLDFNKHRRTVGESMFVKSLVLFVSCIKRGTIAHAMASENQV